MKVVKTSAVVAGSLTGVALYGLKEACKPKNFLKFVVDHNLHDSIGISAGRHVSQTTLNRLPPHLQACAMPLGFTVRELVTGQTGHVLRAILGANSSAPSQQPAIASQAVNQQNYDFVPYHQARNGMENFGPFPGTQTGMYPGNHGTHPAITGNVDPRFLAAHEELRASRSGSSSINKRNFSQESSSSTQFQNSERQLTGHHLLSESLLPAIDPENLARQVDEYINQNPLQSGRRDLGPSKHSPPWMHQGYNSLHKRSPVAASGPVQRKSDLGSKVSLPKQLLTTKEAKKLSLSESRPSDKSFKDKNSGVAEQLGISCDVISDPHTTTSV